jgi:hypothetical protein
MGRTSHAAVGLVAGLLLSQAGTVLTAADEQRMRGELVDPASYLKTGQRGPEAEDNTYAAVDGGQTLAFLEEATGAFYLLLADAPGEDPNELAYDYVNKPVNVIGTVYERAGLKGIVLTQVEQVAVEEPQVEEPLVVNEAPTDPEDVPE